MLSVKITLLLLAVALQERVNGEIADGSDNNTCESVLPTRLLTEIESYGPVVNRIINATMSGDFKGSTWLELSNFVDKFGSRFTGTKNLEDSIDYVMNKSMELGLENVHGERATVPRWVR